MLKPIASSALLRYTSREKSICRLAATPTVSTSAGHASHEVATSSFHNGRQCARLPRYHQQVNHSVLASQVACLKDLRPSRLIQ